MSQRISPAEKLLTLYNEIDHYMRRECKVDRHADHGYLIQQMAANNPVVARNQQLMRAVAQIRNSLVHNPIPKIAQPLLLPSLDLVRSYAKIHSTLLHPQKAIHIAIPAHKIYTSTLDANLLQVMKIMHKRIYTHVPILEDDKMIGILSENSIMSYLVTNGESIITRTMQIKDLINHIPLETHHGECFEFLPKNASVADVYRTFNKAIKKHERIGMVFITEHGKPHEKPLGIITAWDLATPESIY